MLFRYGTTVTLFNVFSTVPIRYPRFRMAACFSSPSILACPPVYVISHIPNMAECLKACALPGIQVKPVDVSDISEKDPVFSEEKINTFRDAEITVCDGNLLAKVYKCMPNLKWAHCTWAGVDSLIKEMKEEPSFTLTRHSGVTFCGMMAEYVMCHILNCERQSKLCWKNQNSKIWSQDGKISTYRTLDELTISVLGVGNMASEIAKILKARGATIYGFARNPRSSSQFGDFDKISTNMEDILLDCDYLCNTLPSTPLTRGILNTSVLQKCKKNPVFINVGRGDVITENELVGALRTRCLSGAVLDVFETEPLPESSQLWDMLEVTITPHVAAVSIPEHSNDKYEGYFFSRSDWSLKESFGENPLGLCADVLRCVCSWPGESVDSWLSFLST
ncbi:Glyoxylate/hydroxypyruvate reductase A [Araneus ventricosus]|uniref:Glyoxylate/hydroxypyruvate reductase A n=1 Tax=Araneus ventricosus TaxID=182803 RepID=A0A4Y1ZZ55_ARAVE|nr:Glyoxylate/hydroxypyruvate reductase A [Araneus ventricosus]